MAEAVMTETERAEVLDTMIANEQSHELSSAVEQLRGVDEPTAQSLVRYADYLSAEVKGRVREIIREHPERHAAILSLLRTVLTWIDKDRVELQSTQFSGLRIAPGSDAARKLRDLDFFERFVRNIGRDILMASTFQKNRMA